MDADGAATVGVVFGPQCGPVAAKMVEEVIRPDVNPAMEGLLKEQPGFHLFSVFGQPRKQLTGPDANGEHRVAIEGVGI